MSPIGRGGNLAHHRPLYLLEYPTVSGGERSLLEVVRRGGPAVCLVPEGAAAQAFRSAGVEVIPFQIERGPGGIDRTAQRIARLSRELEATLIHANTLMTAELAGLAGAAAELPSVAHVRDILKLSARRIERIRSVDRLLAVSKAASAALVAQGIPEEQLQVIYNGIDLGRVSPPTIVPDRGPLPPDVPLISILGQISLRKGSDLFLEAASRCAKRFDRVHFCVAGARFSVKDEAVQLEKSIRERARTDPALAGRVHFPGWIEDPLPLIRASDIVVSASREEPLSRVLLEASALARPMVATHVGGTPEIVEEGVTGRLVPPDNPKALAEALGELLSDPALGRRWGRSARSLCETRFDAEETARAVFAVHNELTESTRSAQMSPPNSTPVP